MNLLEAALRLISSDLSRGGLRWVLVGGFAVSARAEPRFTRDVDIAIAVDDDAEAEHIVRILLGAGYSVGGMIEHETTGRLATVRLIPQQHPINGEVVVDVLFASSGIEPEIVASAERLDILPGLTMPVARTGHLIALKLLARAEDRPQDDADLRALLAVASDADLDLARTSCAQIVARGFNRDRDLLAALREILDR